MIQWKQIMETTPKYYNKKERALAIFQEYQKTHNISYVSLLSLFTSNKKARRKIDLAFCRNKKNLQIIEDTIRKQSENLDEIPPQMIHED